MTGAADGFVESLLPSAPGGRSPSTFASEAQLGEMAAGAGWPIAGPVADAVLRASARIARTCVAIKSHTGGVSEKAADAAAE